MARRPTVHEAISSRKAPKPVGPYVQAIRIAEPGAMLFVSGQIPIELPSGRVFTGDIKRQAELVLTHLRNVVQDAKFSMEELAKVTIFVKDLGNFDAINEVYEKFFVGQSLPARAVVEVARLPKDVGIEIEAVAVKKASLEDALSDDDFR